MHQERQKGLDYCLAARVCIVGFCAAQGFASNTPTMLFSCLITKVSMNEDVSKAFSFISTIYLRVLGS